MAVSAPSRAPLALALALVQALATLAPATASAADEPHADLPEMVRRNLFSPERKPNSPDQADGSPQGDSATPKNNLPPSAIQLDAVFIYGDRPAAALVRVDARLKQPKPKDSKQPQSPPSPYLVAHEGERLGEYQVEKIEPGRVLLAKDGQTFVIALHQEGKAKPPEPLASEPAQQPAQQPVQPVPSAQAGQPPAQAIPQPQADQPPVFESPVPAPEGAEPGAG